jgi:hypothetical protein
MDRVLKYKHHFLVFYSTLATNFTEQGWTLYLFMSSPWKISASWNGGNKCGVLLFRESVGGLHKLNVAEFLFPDTGRCHRMGPLIIFGKFSILRGALCKTNW